jgi:hypothetical protein
VNAYFVNLENVYTIRSVLITIKRVSICLECLFKDENSKMILENNVKRENRQTLNKNSHLIKRKNQTKDYLFWTDLFLPVEFDWGSYYVITVETWMSSIENDFYNCWGFQLIYFKKIYIFSFSFFVDSFNDIYKIWFTQITLLLAVILVE